MDHKPVLARYRGVSEHRNSLHQLNQQAMVLINSFYFNKYSARLQLKAMEHGNNVIKTSNIMY